MLEKVMELHFLLYAMMLMVMRSSISIRSSRIFFC